MEYRDLQYEQTNIGYNSIYPEESVKIMNYVKQFYLLNGMTIKHDIYVRIITHF